MTTKTKTKKITKVHAEMLWSELRDGLVNVDKKIKEIIEARAWEPLGYDSFTAAWAERMAGVRLATEAIKAHVVYAMYDELGDTQAVVKALGTGNGITPIGVQRLKQQKDNGVHPDLATSYLRGQRRDPEDIPAEKAVVVTFPNDDFIAYRDHVGGLVALESLIKDLTVAHFKDLV